MFVFGILCVFMRSRSLVTEEEGDFQSEAPEATLVRGMLYQSTVKKGDILLNRLKKLARIIDF
jgi:hypothetical protein